MSLLEADVDSLDGRALAARLREVDRAIRKLEAAAVLFEAEAERRQKFRDASGYARPDCPPPPN